MFHTQKFLQSVSAVMFLASVACGENVDSPMTHTPLQIEVHGDGAIIADGAPVDLNELAALLEQLKEKNGVVWYYRENPESPEPPEISFKVLDLIAGRQVPICLSPTPDFAVCRSSGNS